MIKNISTLCFLFALASHLLLSLAVAQETKLQAEYFVDHNELEEFHKIPEKLLQCKDVSECILIKGLCGLWTPTNAKFESKAKEWAQEHNRVVNCIHNSGPKPSLICRNNLCDYRIVNESR